MHYHFKHQALMLNLQLWVVVLCCPCILQNDQLTKNISERFHIDCFYFTTIFGCIFKSMFKYITQMFLALPALCYAKE